MASFKRKPKDPVTDLELRGWYFYDWANSVYSAVAITLFLPLIILDLAKAAVDEDGYVYFGSIALEPVACSTLFMSLSVAFQAFVFVSIGAIADFGNLRKLFLGICAIGGSCLTMCIIFVGKGELWWLVGTMAICTNILFGSSLVFYNAFLPLIVDAHPDVIEASNSDISPEEFRKLHETKSNEISSRGYIMGYASSLVMIVVSGIVVFIWDTPEGETIALRFAVFLAGLFWLTFSIYSLWNLKNRPGPKLPEGEAYIFLAWKRLWGTFKYIRKLKNTFIFLFAYFLVSDGYNTIASVGILFAADDLNMGNFELVLIAFETPLFALAGNLFFVHLHKKYSYSSKHIVMINILIMMLCPVYGLLGFIPSSPIGLKNGWEMYLFACVYGFNLGSIQSFNRVLYASLIPEGHESELFSLYEITDKGASWLGTFLVTIIRSYSGDMRYNLLVLIGMLLVPLFPLWYCDPVQGEIEARTFNEEEEEKKKEAELAIINAQYNQSD